MSTFYDDNTKDRLSRILPLVAEVLRYLQHSDQTPDPIRAIGLNSMLADIEYLAERAMLETIHSVDDGSKDDGDLGPIPF